MNDINLGYKINNKKGAKMIHYMNNPIRKYCYRQEKLDKFFREEDES